jgi:hypothetical protein
MLSFVGARRGPMGAGRGGRGGFGRDNWVDKRDGQSLQKAGDRFNKDARSRFGGRGGRGGGRGFDSWRDKPQRVRYKPLLSCLLSLSVSPHPLSVYEPLLAICTNMVVWHVHTL